MDEELNFSKWKRRLRNDCIAEDKVREFASLSDSILKILYENGLDPSVKAIVKHGINGKAPERRV